MQGRLSPAPMGRPQAFPWHTWQAEFERAAACGFDRIEWLVTDEGFDENPLCTDAGVAAIKERVAATGVRVTSVCADFCMARPLVRVTAAERQSTVERLLRLVEQLALIDANVLLIPLLEQGAMRDRADDATVASALAPVLVMAKACGLRLGLECDLAVADQRALVERSASGALGVYYDVGNATAAGHDAADEVRAFGAALFGMHIKDRTRGGGSVPLGRGAVNFPAVFAALAVTNYAGTLILETPVGDDAVAMAGQHLAFVRDGLR